jgi:AraC-like DNA-binding protein
MKKGQDVSVTFPGLYLVHHNLPAKEIARHSHSEHLLFVPLQGEIRIETESAVHVLGPGKMLYLPSKTEHSFQSSETQGERLVCLFKDSAWKKLSPTRHAPSILLVNQLAKELLFYLLLNPRTKNPSSLITALTHTLSESLDSSLGEVQSAHLAGKSRDPRIQRALEQMESRFGGELSMDQVAKSAGLSVRNFNRLFLAEIGLTPKQAHTLFRVNRARELLSSGKRSVTEVALEVGYSSLSQFISVFRRTTGQLPSEFARLGQKQ